MWIAAAVLLAPLPAAATPIAEGLHRLSSHPDGGARPPAYGVRLDGLDGDEDSVFTFDFDANGAAMFLDYDATAGTLRIFGTAFGGRDTGSDYVDPAFWRIDFLYTSVLDLGDVLEVAAPGGSNTGTIARLDGGGDPVETFDLVDFAGPHDHTFQIRLGHRGFAGASGLGWMNHSGFGLDTHAYASDWLFTVGPAVPEPGAALLILAGSLWGVAGRRRARA